MEPIGCLEISVRNYHYALCKIPECDLLKTRHELYNDQSHVQVFVYLSIYFFLTCFGGRGDSSVGIATEYELDGPGIESRWGLKTRVGLK
jgi:hypothetical protein